MKLFELLVALGIMGLLLRFVPSGTNHSLELAQASLQSNLKALKLTALSDDTSYLQLRDSLDLTRYYPAIDAQALLEKGHHSMWQAQFHLGKIYTTHSYSLYIDTPRRSVNTSLDGRPMAGDVILKNLNQQCLSAYNNTNTATECKNNALASVRLGEYYGVEAVMIEGDRFCKERDGARLYFDRYGVPYCGRNPQKIQSPFKVTLLKKGVAKSVCILPHSGEILGC